MTAKTIGTVPRDGAARGPVEVQRDNRGWGEILVWQKDNESHADQILMTPEQARVVKELLAMAIGEQTSAPPAPEPLRRFPALYERLQVHDAKYGETWPEHRYAIEVGTGAKHTEGRAYVRIDGDEADSTAVFLWDEDRRRFDFRGNTNLYLIPVDHFEED